MESAHNCYFHFAGFVRRHRISFLSYQWDFKFGNEDEARSQTEQAFIFGMDEFTKLWTKRFG